MGKMKKDRVQGAEGKRVHVGKIFLFVSSPDPSNPGSVEPRRFSEFV